MRKRPVNLTLNESLVLQAKTYTSNLSATMELLLAQFDVHRNKGALRESIPFVVIVQSAQFDGYRRLAGRAWPNHYRCVG